MTEGICLYGSKRKLAAPTSFTVDTGVGCFLFGSEHYLCKYLDTIIFDRGSSLKAIIKRLIKEAIKDVLEGDIDTNKFCEAGASLILPEINYLDVFLCFNGTSCEVLTAKIAELYRYQKWFEYCECVPLPPVPPSPDPNIPFPIGPDGLPIYPPDPVAPPGDCSAYFSRLLSIVLYYTQLARQELERLVTGNRQQGNRVDIAYVHSGDPIRGFPPGNWVSPNFGVANPCDCKIRRDYAVTYDLIITTPDGYATFRNGNFGSANAIVDVYSFRQDGCPDTPDGPLPIPYPPPAPDFYPDFPWLKPKKKKKTGGAKCSCCNYQWTKNPNELYLPSRYKI